MMTPAAMQFLIANCPLGLSQHLSSGEFVAASPGCERLLGRPGAELVGRELFLFIQQPAQTEVRQAWSRVGTCGGELQVRFPYLRPDAAALWIELTIRAGPAMDEQPAAAACDPAERQLFCCWQDVTAAVTAEAARAARLAEAELAERHRDYLVSMTPGLVWFGPVSPDLTSYRAVYMSQYLFRVTGYTAKQWLETPGFWRSIIHPEDREHILQEAPLAMAQGRVIGPYRIIASDGRVLWIQSQTLIERDAAGVPLRMYGLTLDMTSFQQAETERMRLREEVANQAQRLLELSAPLIPVSEDVLVMPVIGTLDPARAQFALETVLGTITASRSRYLIVDLTGVSIVDPEGAAALLRMVQAVRLLGAQAVITGMRGEIAQAIIGLGIDLQGVVVRASLRAAIGEFVTTPRPARVRGASGQRG